MFETGDINLSLLEIKIKPEYEKLVPALQELEYAELRNSITKNGLYFPIIVNKEGVVLDGHHRYKACKELGIEPQTIQREFSNELEEKKFVIENCIQRRHLNDFQKAELGIPLQKINEELAKKQQGTRSDLTSSPNGEKVKPFHSNKETSNQIGISSRTFDRARLIMERAPEEIKEKVRNNELSISKVYKKLLQEKKREQRREELNKTQIKLPETIQLHNKDFRELQIQDNSISLIFTDPPYLREYLYLYDDLGKQAVRVLKEGGSLICYVGHYALDVIIPMITKHGLTYHWALVIQHGGGSPTVFGSKILNCYKFMLWFTKGKYEGEYVKDMIKSEFQGKELHKWAQSTVESDYYIKYMTMENEIVYDPFMGQGTFGVSAKKLNRQFIGSEIDPAHFETAQRLISS